jgi:hypothetical protein
MELLTRTPRRLAVLGLLLLLLVLLGRWLSPNLNVGTSVTGKWCENRSGYCLEHVERGEWVFLAPVDELHVTYRSQARYYSVQNPFADGADLAVTFGDNGDHGVSVTDGSAVISWPAATLDRLGD